MKYLGQKESIDLDNELFTEYAYSVDQLMELAGLAVALSIYKTYSTEIKKVLMMCGPGNNGGDGLVAARHLALFGFSVAIYYPKRPNKPLLQNLVTQCTRMHNIVFLEDIPNNNNTGFNIVVDAIFGFSFSGTPRDPFNRALDYINRSKMNSKIVSVDIPSGWDVEKGNIHNYFTPDLLVSLTAPKLCSRDFKGTHLLGGRFVPRDLAEKFQLNLPPYPGCEQILDISHVI